MCEAALSQSFKYREPEHPIRITQGIENKVRFIDAVCFAAAIFNVKFAIRRCETFSKTERNSNSFGR